MDSGYAVKIENLYKIVNDFKILDNINVSFSKGKIHGIIGHNGSGKTMLFKAICGLINPTSGKIFIFDKQLKKGEFPKETGVIIENPGFLPQYSGFMNLKILASINNIVTDDDIKHYLKLVGLNEEDKRPVKKYSLGMKQRLGIAQALMEKPKLLILDEPMNALDEEAVCLVRKLLINLRNEGVTILLCSHNSEDIESLCDFKYKMNKGILAPIL